MLGLILVIFLIVILLGGVVPFGTSPGYHGYGFGTGGIGVIGVILIIVLVLVLSGRF